MLSSQANAIRCYAKIRCKTNQIASPASGDITNPSRLSQDLFHRFYRLVSASNSVRLRRWKREATSAELKFYSFKIKRSFDLLQFGSFFWAIILTVIIYDYGMSLQQHSENPKLCTTLFEHFLNNCVQQNLFEPSTI